MAQGLFNLKQVIQAVQQGGWGTQKPPSVEYLVIAGGGAGGGGYGTGGGAGGLLAGIANVPVNQSLTVTIGGGGAGVNNAPGNNGSNSVLGQISATGGGYGVSGYGVRSNSGGSGGGSAGNTGKNLWGEGIAGQGFRGGNGGQETGSSQGGGGGAGSRGVDASGGDNGGAGGVGAASAITGTVTAYAGGGGGGLYGGTSGNQGIGGAGGGGAAGNGGSSNNGIAATANTGGGGGGATVVAGGNTTGGNGGSGLVAISYPDTYAAAASTTGSPTVSTSGSGSINFASAGYLSTGTGTAPSQSGNFTLECWLNLSTFNQNGGYALICGTSSGANFIGFYNSNFMLCSSTSGSPTQIACTLPSTNTWFHYCLMRSGATVYAFLNGVLQGAVTWNETLFAAGSLLVGGYGAVYFCPGYMSNFRVTNTAVYSTSGFTPSTTPLTKITGTALLMNTVSGAYAADATGTWSFYNNYTAPTWNASSPFATGLGYKNRVYTWTSSGSITF